MIETIYNTEKFSVYILLYVSHDIRSKVRKFLSQNDVCITRRFLYENELTIANIRRGYVDVFNFIIKARLDSASIFDINILLNGNLSISCNTGTDTLVLNTSDYSNWHMKKYPMEEYWRKNGLILTRFDDFFVLNSVLYMFANNNLMDGSDSIDTLGKILKISAINCALSYLFVDHTQQENYVHTNDPDFIKTGMSNADDLLVRTFQSCIQYGKDKYLFLYGTGPLRGYNRYDIFMCSIIESVFNCSNNPIGTIIRMLLLMMIDRYPDQFVRIIKRFIFAMYSALNKDVHALLDEFKRCIRSRAELNLFKLYVVYECDLCSEQLWINSTK